MGIQIIAFICACGIAYMFATQIMGGSRNIEEVFPKPTRFVLLIIILIVVAFASVVVQPSTPIKAFEQSTPIEGGFR